MCLYSTVYTWLIRNKQAGRHTAGYISLMGTAVSYYISYFISDTGVLEDQEEQVKRRQKLQPYVFCPKK